MITRETANAISRTYREIEAAEKLLLEVDKEIAKGNALDFHGEERSLARNLQLGWPMMSNGGYQCYQVEANIGRSILVAHISDQKSKLVKLNELAKLETRE